MDTSQFLQSLITAIPANPCHGAGLRMDSPLLTRACRLVLRHCPCSLGSAVPLGQPLCKHLCLEDFKLGPLLCLGTERGMSTEHTSASWDPTPQGGSLTVISPFFLASFINFFLFFFPLKAKSNSCRALATRVRTECGI